MRIPSIIPFTSLGLIAGLCLAACQSQQVVSPQQDFLANLKTLCGQAFEGRVISTEEVDADWRKETLIMYVRDCDETGVKIPLHVGENRSRTWVIQWAETGKDLQLKHIHKHKDGTLDDVTWYGGDADAGTATSTHVNFPVDEFSKTLFLENDLDVSVVNVWRVSLTPGETFTYALSRPNRDFRAEFDLTRPVQIPPPSW